MLERIFYRVPLNQSLPAFSSPTRGLFRTPAFPTGDDLIARSDKYAIDLVDPSSYPPVLATPCQEIHHHLSAIHKLAVRNQLGPIKLPGKPLFDNMIPRICQRR